MEQDWKSTSNKIMQHEEISLFTQYHDLEMIHVQYFFHNAIINFISIIGFRIHMQYLLYSVICFKVRNNTREVFVANVVGTTLVDHMVFTRRHDHDAKVVSMWYKKANGIPSPFSNDTYSP
jgi:hypothetical protein